MAPAPQKPVLIPKAREELLEELRQVNELVKNATKGSEMDTGKEIMLRYLRHKKLDITREISAIMVNEEERQ